MRAGGVAEVDRPIDVCGQARGRAGEQDDKIAEHGWSVVWGFSAIDKISAAEAGAWRKKVMGKCVNGRRFLRYGCALFEWRGFLRVERGKCLNGAGFGEFRTRGA